MSIINQISIAIPTFNRFEMVRRAVANVIEDPRVGEVVICDDASTDGSFAKLCEWVNTFMDVPMRSRQKIKLFRNETNLDCYANKAQSLRHATLEWAVLFDSDNVMGVDYLDRLFEMQPWANTCSYLPVHAAPTFDYREFSGHIIKSENVAKYMANSTFRCALNTANYLVHRETYLGVWNGHVDPHTADSMYMNYRLLEAGKWLVFVPNLTYLHLIHDQSHYKNECHKTGNFVHNVEKKLRALR